MSLVAAPQAIAHDVKERKGRFLSMLLGKLLGRLGTSLSGNLLLGKGAQTERGVHRVIRASNVVIQGGLRTFNAALSLNIFKIQRH